MIFCSEKSVFVKTGKKEIKSILLKYHYSTLKSKNFESKIYSKI